MIACGIANYYAITTPFFAVTEPLLTKHEFSIIQSIFALYDKGNIGFAAFIGTIVVGTHALKWLAICYVWFTKVSLNWLEKSQEIVEGINKLCMLDVFTLGFALFIIEAEAIVKVESRSGLIVMWIAVALNYLLDALTSYSIYSYVKKIRN